MEISIDFYGTTYLKSRRQRLYMSDIEFSKKTDLTGTREEVAKAIVDLIRKEGPKKTAQLRDSLYEEFEDEYQDEDSFHRTLSYIREPMVDDGLVETVRDDSQGSRKTWKWMVKN